MARTTPPRPAKAKKVAKAAEPYTHPDQTLLLRPEVGTQSQFRKKKPPVTYRFDSSLSPALEWDGQPGGFEAGEHRQVAVKVIDDRGNELLVVERLE
jgi:hypothetical protein